jgi:hypothetical protein
MKIATAVLAAFVLLPAAAQSPGYTPTAAEAKQARDNAARDAKLADEMQKARVQEEAKPVSTFIPKPEAPAETRAMKNPETFTAAVPGSGKKKAKEKATKEKSPKETKKAAPKKKQKQPA